MNYQESTKILNLIKKSKKILLGCHRNPDPDSIGCVLGLNLILEELGKDVAIVSPTEIQSYVEYLPNYSKIKVVDFNKFDLSPYDLFITIDSSSWEMITNIQDYTPSHIAMINIDHHKTNDRIGSINLLDSQKASCGEILFLIFEDWKIKFDTDIADCLMAAIVGDTGGFRFPGVSKKTFQIASDLMEKGADKNKAIFNIYSRYDIKTVKLWGEILRAMEVDERHGFVWSAVPFERCQELGILVGGRETSATMFGTAVEAVDFSVFMVEQEKNILSVSFRSRTGFDTSVIAKELGGGGHVYASGATVRNLPFKVAVERVLQTTRKYAEK